MSWKDFKVYKIVLSVIILIIGLILKFPGEYETLPQQYKILGIMFTQVQYNIINIISYILIIFSLIFIVILLVDKFKK